MSFSKMIELLQNKDKALNKYIKLIQEKGYSYILYNFDNNTSKLTILNKYNGNKINNIEENKLNCYTCSNTVKMYKKNDKYIQAVADLYEEEKEDRKNSKRKIIWIRKRKKKIKKLKEKIKLGKMTSREAHKYLAGHMGYIKIANVKNLTEKIFYNE